MINIAGEWHAHGGASKDIGQKSWAVTRDSL
jgi:hypothetical protein